MYHSYLPALAAARMRSLSLSSDPCHANTLGSGVDGGNAGRGWLDGDDVISMATHDQRPRRRDREVGSGWERGER